MLSIYNLSKVFDDGEGKNEWKKSIDDTSSLDRLTVKIVNILKNKWIYRWIAIFLFMNENLTIKKFLSRTRKFVVTTNEKMSPEILEKPKIVKGKLAKTC